MYCLVRLLLPSLGAPLHRSCRKPPISVSSPNILNLLAFAGVITFDGFFLGPSRPL